MKLHNCALFAGTMFGITHFVGTAGAQVILFDNFDGYANQAAFEATWVPIGTLPPSALLSTEQAVSVSNSIKVPGNAVASPDTAYRNRRTFIESGLITLAQPFVFSFDFFDIAGTGNPQRNFINLQDGTSPSGANQLISLGLNNSQTSTESGGNFYMARILGYTPPSADPEGGAAEKAGLTSGAYFKLNDYGVGLRSAGWHNLKVVISTDDGTTSDYAFYVDNVLVEQVNNFAGAFRSYDNVALGAGVSNGNTTAYFDNVNVAAVPEPGSTLFLLGSVGLVALRRRRA
jgi:hypothetical protein